MLRDDADRNFTQKREFEKLYRSERQDKEKLAVKLAVMEAKIGECDELKK